MVDGLVSLERYRDASKEIFAVFKKHLSPCAILEKASVDEAYIDVTKMVDELPKGMLSLHSYKSPMLQLDKKEGSTKIQQQIKHVYVKAVTDRAWEQQL